LQYLEVVKDLLDCGLERGGNIIRTKKEVGTKGCMAVCLGRMPRP